MNDLQLLELAAKAAAVPFTGYIFRTGSDAEGSYSKGGLVTKGGVIWNPLTDDGDALRLAVKLKIDVVFISGDTLVLSTCFGGPDKMLNTRRAIVHAAAEIGRAMS